MASFLHSQMKRLNIIYFFNPHSNSPRLAIHLESNICRRNYIFYQQPTGSKPVGCSTWSKNCALAIFDCVPIQWISNHLMELEQMSGDYPPTVWINSTPGEFLSVDGILESFSYKKPENSVSNISSLGGTATKIFCRDKNGYLLVTKDCQAGNVWAVLDFFFIKRAQSFEVAKDWIGYFIGDEQGYGLVQNVQDHEYKKNMDLQYEFVKADESKLNESLFLLMNKKLRVSDFKKNTIIFTCLSSTIDFAEVFCSTNVDFQDSLIVMALEQVRGRGRGSNLFISNFGTLMLTIIHPLPPIPITIVQHIVALSFVQSIKRNELFKDLPLKIKWPNDIYYGKNEKIGGVLVKLSSHTTTKMLLTSIGVNIFNSEPTTCLQKIIQTHVGEDVEISMDDIYNNFIDQFFVNLSKPIDQLVKEYLEHWIHQNEMVKVKTDMFTNDVKVIGIDENGFLQIDLCGEVKSVGPDGNSFDVFHNLLILNN